MEKKREAEKAEQEMFLETKVVTIMAVVVVEGTVYGSSGPSYGRRGSDRDRGGNRDGGRIDPLGEETCASHSSGTRKSGS